MRKFTLRTGFLFCAMILTTLVVVACEDSEEKEQKKAMSEAQQNATVLPVGVRDKWFLAVNRALESVEIYKGRFRIPGIWSGVQYVPVTAVTASCSPSEIILRESGENSVITLVGVFSIVKHSEALWNLGVGHNSPAAQKLMDELCRHIVDWLDKRTSE